MPLRAPIAASPQSNVLAGLTTMVEVPPGSAPGPRGPGLSSGRTAVRLQRRTRRLRGRAAPPCHPAARQVPLQH